MHSSPRYVPKSSSNSLQATDHFARVGRSDALLAVKPHFGASVRAFLDVWDGVDQFAIEVVDVGVDASCFEPGAHVDAIAA